MTGKKSLIGALTVALLLMSFASYAQVARDPSLDLTTTQLRKSTHGNQQIPSARPSINLVPTKTEKPSQAVLITSTSPADGTQGAGLNIPVQVYLDNQPLGGIVYFELSTNTGPVMVNGQSKIPVSTQQDPAQQPPASLATLEAATVYPNKTIKEWDSGTTYQVTVFDQNYMEIATTGVPDPFSFNTASLPYKADTNKTAVESTLQAQPNTKTTLEPSYQGQTNTKTQQPGYQAQPSNPVQPSNPKFPVGKIDAWDFESVSAGSGHTCGVRFDHRVACWGDNTSGQLGVDKTITQASTTIPLGDAITGVTSIAAGKEHTCALVKVKKADGTEERSVKCWGLNDQGQLGYTNISYNEKPISTKVSGLETDIVQKIIVGDSHSCALLVTGKVKCWGSNVKGQLGQPPSMSNSDSALAVPGVSDATALATSGDRSCAVKDDGSVFCWGANTEVSPNIGNVSQIALGKDHTCVLTKAGTVKCWGLNTYGQIGDGGKQPSYLAADAPVVLNLSQVLDITAGLYHTCALKMDLTTWCWGANSKGQLGIDSYDNQNQPQKVHFNNALVVSLDAGDLHTCAIAVDTVISERKTFCWGDNGKWQLGNDYPFDDILPLPLIATPSEVYQQTE